MKPASTHRLSTRLAAAALVLCMVLGLFPAAALAADGPEWTKEGWKQTPPYDWTFTLSDEVTEFTDRFSTGLGEQQELHIVNSEDGKDRTLKLTDITSFDRAAALHIGNESEKAGRIILDAHILNFHPIPEIVINPNVTITRFDTQIGSAVFHSAGGRAPVIDGTVDINKTGTTLTLESGTLIKAGSTVTVWDDTELIIDGDLTVEKGAKIVFTGSNSTLDLTKSGTVKAEEDAFQFENATTVIEGTNPAVSKQVYINVTYPNPVQPGMMTADDLDVAATVNGEPAALKGKQVSVSSDEKKATVSWHIRVPTTGLDENTDISITVTPTGVAVNNTITGARCYTAGWNTEPPFDGGGCKGYGRARFDTLFNPPRVADTVGGLLAYTKKAVLTADVSIGDIKPKNTANIYHVNNVQLTRKSAADEKGETVYVSYGDCENFPAGTELIYEISEADYNVNKDRYDLYYSFIPNDPDLRDNASDYYSIDSTGRIMTVQADVDGTVTAWFADRGDVTFTFDINEGGRPYYLLNENNSEAVTGYVEGSSLTVPGATRAIYIGANPSVGYEVETFYAEAGGSRIGQIDESGMLVITVPEGAKVLPNATIFIRYRAKNSAADTTYAVNAGANGSIEYYLDGKSAEAKKVTGASVTAPAGTKSITFTAKPDAGYEVDTFTAKDASGKDTGTRKDNSITITAGSAGLTAATITAAFKAVQAAPAPVRFTVNTGANGSVQFYLDGKSAEAKTAGATVEAPAGTKSITFIAKPDAGYEVDTFTAKDAAGKDVGTRNVIYITIAAGTAGLQPATVTATFKAVQAPSAPVRFTVNAGANGSVQYYLDGKSAEAKTAGTTVEAPAGTKSITFTAKPDAGYEVDTFTAKDAAGKDIGTRDGSSITISAGTAGLQPATITATFKAAQTPAPSPVRFTVNAGANGSVQYYLDGKTAEAKTAGTTVEVPAGTKSVTFTAKPDAGYEIDAFTAKDASGKDTGTASSDGSSITITAGTAGLQPATITAAFKAVQAAPASVKFTVNAGKNGSIEYYLDGKTAEAKTAGTTVEVPAGTKSVTFTAKPDAGYEVDAFTAKDASGKDTGTASSDGSSITITAGTAGLTAATVTATFKAAQATVKYTVSAGKNGSASWYLNGNADGAKAAEASVEVPANSSSITFVAEPDVGFVVDTLSAAGADGKETGTRSGNQITIAAAGGTLPAASVSMTFKAADAGTVPYTIYAGANGSVQYWFDDRSSEAQTVSGAATAVAPAGTKSVTFTAKPASGYRVSSISAAGADGKSVGTVSGTAVTITIPEGAEILPAAEIRAQFTRQSSGGGGSTGGGGHSGSTSKPGGSTSKPGTESVVTDTHTGPSGTVTETTAVPAVSQNGSTASASVSASTGEEMVEQAVEKKSGTVVVAPKFESGTARSEVSIPGSTVKNLADRTDADLRVETPAADITIPGAGLPALGGTGSLTVTAEVTEDGVSIEISTGSGTVSNVAGGVTVEAAAEHAGTSTVLVLIHDDGTEDVIRTSLADPASGTVRAVVSGSAELGIRDGHRDFEDIPAGSWFEEAVDFASSHELMNGISGAQFAPSEPATRAQIAQLLYNLENGPDAGSSSFSDVEEGAWYAEAVSWAAEAGLVQGYGSGMFGPDDVITREQLAVILCSYAKYKGADVEVSAGLDSFTDAPAVSSWAADALGWAVEKGLITGTGNSTLNPGGQADRAQIAAILSRYVQLVAN